MAEQEAGDDYNPFTDEDLEKILHAERSTAREEGWTFLKKTDLYEVWKRVDSDRPVHLVKGFLNFNGIPPETVAEIIHDVESRSKWDKLFPVIEVLENHKHYRVVYWVTKLPPGVADRDLVQNISRRYDEATNTTYLMYHHTTHPDRPERSGIVRAETILSGVIIRPHPDDPKSTRLSLMLQVDMKGWIPHFIVNAFAARSPGNWQSSLLAYYWNVYSKEQQQEQQEEDQHQEVEGQQEEHQEQQEQPQQQQEEKPGEGQQEQEGEQQEEQEQEVGEQQKEEEQQEQEGEQQEEEQEGDQQEEEQEEDQQEEEQEGDQEEQ